MTVSVIIESLSDEDGNGIENVTGSEAIPMTGNWNASIGPSGLRLAFPQPPLVLRLPGHCFVQSVEQKLKPT